MTSAKDGQWGKGYRTPPPLFFSACPMLCLHLRALFHDQMGGIKRSLSQAIQIILNQAVIIHVMIMFQEQSSRKDVGLISFRCLTLLVLQNGVTTNTQFLSLNGFFLNNKVQGTSLGLDKEI